MTARGGVDRRLSRRWQRKRFPLVEDFEARNLLRLAVVEDLEILGREILDRLPVAVHDVDRHLDHDDPRLLLHGLRLRALGFLREHGRRKAERGQDRSGGSDSDHRAHRQPPKGLVICDW